MSSLRDVKNDLLKDWLYFRDENFCHLLMQKTEST